MSNPENNVPAQENEPQSGSDSGVTSANFTETRKIILEQVTIDPGTGSTSVVARHTIEYGQAPIYIHDIEFAGISVKPLIENELRTAGMGAPFESMTVKIRKP